VASCNSPCAAAASGLAQHLRKLGAQLGRLGSRGGRTSG
jgi:hypothetical protein